MEDVKKKLREAVEDGRVKLGYRNTRSKDGSLSLHLSPEINVVIKAYCQPRGYDKASFIEFCLVEMLNELFQNQYTNMSREELVAELERRDAQEELRLQLLRQQIKK